MSTHTICELEALKIVGHFGFPIQIRNGNLNRVCALKLKSNNWLNDFKQNENIPNLCKT